MNAAIENLKTNQRQLDADGCEVGVSRQALDEALALLDSMDHIQAYERARCVAIVNAARSGEIDGDLRCLISRMTSGDPFPEPTE